MSATKEPPISMSEMDPIRLGRSLRALRRRRGWRQGDLAASAGVSRAAISRIELGLCDRSTVRALESVATALGARLDLRLSWNGEALDRLLDSAHARLVELVVVRLERRGWEVVPEVSFNVAGERGSIDILALHRPTGSLLVVEVKSVVPDIQAMLGGLDRKTRLARQIGRERGWPAAGVARLLVIGDDRTARRRVAAFEATFRRAYPIRGHAVDRWLRSPDPEQAMSGLRFLSDAHQAGARHRIARPGGHRAAR
ncbi:MAG: Helix-turn-helix domain [Chloroflexota bacterium]|jgi:transcriptional regulator with XRE-family HTH domain|nr:Helix-turn-helix domain [Chloroflexota bacterium]